MKSTFNVLGLALVLCAGVAAGYFLASNRSPDTTQPTPVADDMIVIDAPRPGTVISSPLKVTGRARGNWYFEASFPIELTDANGSKLAQTAAQATSDWMTTEWVPFEATVTFVAADADTTTGTLILRKDNPSGLPENDDSRSIQVRFK